VSALLTATTLEEFLAGSDTSSPTDRVQRIGLILAAGGVLLATGLGTLVGPLDDDDRSLLRRIGLLGGLVTCFGSIVELIARANRVEVSWLDALRSDQGTAPMMRFLAGALIVAGLSDSTHEDDERPAVSLFATVGVMVGLLSFAFDGHTTSEGPRVIHALVDIVHVTAAGVWFGGVVGLAALAIRAPLGGPRSLVLHRFATTAMLAVVVVSAAGVAMAVLILDAPGDLTSTGWGKLLVVKVAIVLACVALGVYHHFGVARRLANGDESAAARGRARFTLLLEAVLLAAVIVVTAWLVATSPT
jgi:putative copper export protein